jgi:maleamate amidohydrolase
LTGAGKPWDGAIGPEDRAAFLAGGGQEDRPIEAGDHPALIIVDMTRAFVDSRYPTGWSPTGYPAVGANRKLLTCARELGVPVFMTKSWPDSRPPTAMERGRWRHGGSSPGARDLPPGDVIVDELAPEEGEIVIHKRGKPSGFFGTTLASYLVYCGADTTIITGMATSGCVRATVLDAFSWNYHVLIPHECVADRSQISHRVTLFDLHMKYADVITLDETLEYLRKVANC